MDKFQLPEGVGDSLPNYMYRRYALEDCLKRVFLLRGYDPVDTSVIENAKTYRGTVGAVEDNRLFQFQDRDGSLVALRADMTLPLSRIVATKLQAEFPLRLFYISQSFNLNTAKNLDREFFQAGVELFGVRGAEADAEVISVAIEALLSAGLVDFLIDIGQVGIVKGILKEYSEEKQKEVVAFIDKKNLLSADLGLPEETVAVLNAVSALYGEEEVLASAEELLRGYPESMKALCNLKEVYALLKSRGYDKYISFDLGLVNSYSYYSGIVFKGMTASFGASVLGGGRYDKLLSNYGKNIPATGMAIGIRNLLVALDRQGNVSAAPKINVVVGGAGQGKFAAAEYAEKMRNEGKRATDSYRDTKEGLLLYARTLGAESALFFDNEGRAEEVL